jgi:hypothetical protein
MTRMTRMTRARAIESCEVESCEVERSPATREASMRGFTPRSSSRSHRLKRYARRGNSSSPAGRRIAVD